MYRAHAGSARRGPDGLMPHAGCGKSSPDIAASAEQSYFWRMLRFLSRLAGYWLLAAALVAAVVDGAKSIAASALVLTPIGETWSMVAARLASGEEPAQPDAAAAPLAWPLDVLSAWLVSVPTAALLAVLGFVFLAVGRKRRRLFLGREYAA